MLNLVPRPFHHFAQHWEQNNIMSSDLTLLGLVEPRLSGVKKVLVVRILREADA